jgi:2-oxo-4-hydroxy-4-carboxy-5-ureidoimidazoline decarboxylase
MTVDQLNRLPRDAARAALERCCGAGAWVERMCAARPFADAAALLDRADREWRALGPGAWREAFAHHPRIGDVDALRKRFASTAAWAADEQRGAAAASEATLAALAEGNRRYEERFGFIFIVCATGKDAGEMRELLERRLDNDRETEIRIAAEEQMKITRLRLQKLLEEGA